MKLLIITSFSGMYFWSLLRAFRCITALLHNVKMCLLNFNWSSVSIPSIFIEFFTLISLFSIINLCSLWTFSPWNFLFRIIAWNLSQFTIHFTIWIVIYYLNLFIFRDPCYWKFSFNLQNFNGVSKLITDCCDSITVWQNYIILFFKHKNRSLRNILKNTGPSIEQCGTPDKSFKKSQQMLFISTHCLRFPNQLFGVLKLKP